jgi:predicted nucleic acid-binding protein
VAALVDSNILVYAFDPRDSKKQRAAEYLLGEGVRYGGIVLPHQALLEFVAATTRPLKNDPTGEPLLSPRDAYREVEEMLQQFVILYPNEGVVRAAMRGAATYGFSWYDAHLWGYAEHYGLTEIYSEDFEHDRLYGEVRVVNPFVPVDMVNEPRVRYG